MIRPPRLILTTVVVLALATSCGEADEPVSTGDETQSASVPSSSTVPPAPDDSSDDPLPTDIANALLGSGDLAGWSTWEDPSGSGWREQLTPNCETQRVVDASQCEADAAAMAEATSGAVIHLTPYPLDEDRVPDWPEEGNTAGITQFVAVFPDEATADVIVNTDSEPSMGMDTNQDDVAQAEPVQTLGNAAWRWTLDLDEEGFAGRGDQPPQGELVIFRRANVVVALLHMWTGGQSAGSTVEFASTIDSRLPV
jgi:hypothetical protein